MPNSQSDDSDNSVREINESIENILSQLEHFSTGDSIYGTMKSTKRSRTPHEKPTSPETSSPPKKTGRTGRRLRSITNLPKDKQVEPIPGPSGTSSKSRSKHTKSKSTTPLTSLSATPATSISSIVESLEPDSDPSDHDNPIDKTVVEAAHLHNPMDIVPDPILTSIDKYTVTIEFIDYLTGKSPNKPKDFNQVLRLWFRDKWNNLESPPAALTSSMFLACIPPNIPNQEKIQMSLASNNLEMARLCSRYSRKDPHLYEMDFQQMMPNLLYSGQEAKDQPVQTSSLVQEQFLTVIRELLDTIRVLQKDIDRNAFLFRSVCVDTAQGLREGGERMIKEVKAITGLVATATTPIGTPTRDKATAMPPPHNQWQRLQLENQARL